MPANRSSHGALQHMIAEVERLISTTVPLPENRTARCLELLQAAKALASEVGRRERGEPQPEMDDAARHARQEFQQNWKTWTVKQLAVWWQSKYLSVGHKRLGRILMDVAGNRSATVRVRGILID